MINKYDVRLNLECPYCRKTICYLFPCKLYGPTSLVLICDIEEGGCDKEFVVRLQHKYITSTHKIEET